jgi:uncharacterized protein (DUF488 family)
VGAGSKDQETNWISSHPHIWTIGHSTGAAQDFTETLLAYSISYVVDVRSFPGSRRYPQFGKEALSHSLAGAGIRYLHMAKLGGRRRPSPKSKNLAWQNESFRAYADYMETEEFRQGIGELLGIARQGPTAIMCAESVWWRCHRGLIADYLKANGSLVTHIFAHRHIQEHPYTSAARIVDGKLSYGGLFG